MSLSTISEQQTRNTRTTNVGIATFLWSCHGITHIISGEWHFKQVQLHRLLEANADLRSHLSESPEQPAKKVFTAKYPIPVLADYDVPSYPPKYWAEWFRVPITGSKLTPWVNVPEFRRQLESVGVDITSDSVSLILRDLEHGADIGATGRARLPTMERNARSAFEYGDRLQEALQELILQGAMLGPLTEEEIDLAIAKIHAMGTKVKPTGKVRSLVDCSKPRLESEGTPGYIYNPEYPGSLNSTIVNDQFPVNLTSLGIFIGRLWFHGRNAKIAKLDQEAAYRHVPVRQEDLHLQYVKWGDRFFMELKLMFGTKSSPGIYCRFAGLFLLLCVKKTEGMSMADALRYLDDVLAISGEDSTVLENFYQTYKATASEIGVRLDKSGNRAKCQGPDTKVIALGVNFDTQTWEWSMDHDKGAILLHDIERAMSEGNADLKERQRIVGKLQNISYLMYDDRHRMGPLYDFIDGKQTALVEETLVWWQTRVKRSLISQPIPHVGLKSSGDIIYSWTDAAGPTAGHVRGVGVSIPGLGWTVTSWPTWMGELESPVWNEETHSYEEFSTNKMSVLEQLGVLVSVSLLNQLASGRTLEVFIDNSGAVYAFKKGYSRRCRYMNTVIMATLTVSKALGINVVVTDVPRRSDHGSEVADDLSKGIINTVWGFQGSNSRRLVAPHTILGWIKHPTKDDNELELRILDELKHKGCEGIVLPYWPKFGAPTDMEH